MQPDSRNVSQPSNVEEVFRKCDKGPKHECGLTKNFEMILNAAGQHGTEMSPPDRV